jgi:hypothetical protein
VTAAVLPIRMVSPYKSRLGRGWFVQKNRGSGPDQFLFAVGGEDFGHDLAGGLMLCQNFPAPLWRHADDHTAAVLGISLSPYVTGILQPIERQPLLKGVLCHTIASPSSA